MAVIYGVSTVRVSSTGAPTSCSRRSVLECSQTLFPEYPYKEIFPKNPVKEIYKGLTRIHGEVPHAFPELEHRLSVLVTQIHGEVPYAFHLLEHRPCALDEFT